MATQDDLNEDWIKTLSWDLPDTWPVFAAIMLSGSVQQQQEQLQHLQSLPFWQAAPATIQQGAAELMAQTS